MTGMKALESSINFRADESGMAVAAPLAKPSRRSPRCHSVGDDFQNLRSVLGCGAPSGRGQGLTGGVEICRP